MMKKPQPKSEIVIEHYVSEYYHIYTSTRAAFELLKMHAPEFGVFYSYRSDPYSTLEMSKVYNPKEVTRYLLEVCTGQTVTVKPPRIADVSAQSLQERFVSALVRIFPARKPKD
jgi:hypothetical protein